MSLVINHNHMAANTARTLNAHYGRLATSTQRLSSGLRVNSAADDAAGLAIRELQRSDVSALQQGARNANDAISLLQTADGSLGIIDEKLIRMKELAEQAATGTYDSTQRMMIDSEYQAMAREITRIAKATDFNGIKLLDGSLSGQHEGSGISPSGELKVHFGSGNDSAEDYYYIKIDSCTASALGIGLEALSWTKAYDVAVETYADTLKKEIDALPDSSFKTRFVDNYEASIKDFKDKLWKLSTDFDTFYPLWKKPGDEFHDGFYPEGIKWMADVPMPATKDEYLALDDEQREKVQYSCGMAALYNFSIPSKYSNLRFNLGGKGQDLYNYCANPVPSPATPPGAKTSWNIYKEAASTAAKAGLALHAGLRVQTQEEGQRALAAIDNAIIAKDKVRAHLGALQNRLENTVANITIQAENLKAAESRISSTDVATEMTNFVRNQILTQSAVAMLAQANSMPQMAMQLIGG